MLPTKTLTKSGIGLLCSLEEKNRGCRREMDKELTTDFTDEHGWGKGERKGLTTKSTKGQGREIDHGFHGSRFAQELRQEALGTDYCPRQARATLTRRYAPPSPNGRRTGIRKELGTSTFAEGLRRDRKGTKWGERRADIPGLRAVMHRQAIRQSGQDASKNARPSLSLFSAPSFTNR